MMLIEETTVPDAALPVTAFKSHLRIGTGFGQDHLQDDVLRGFLRAALSAIEARTNKVLITRGFTWSLTFWRDPQAQNLPVSPIILLSQLVLIDRSGAETFIPSDQFWLERDAHQPRLRATGGRLPKIPQGGTAKLWFEAGFGPAWDHLPSDLQQAVLLLAAHYYEYRHETSLSDGCMPFGVSSLIERYKLRRIGLGGAR